MGVFLCGGKGHLEIQIVNNYTSLNFEDCNTFLSLNMDTHT